MNRPYNLPLRVQAYNKQFKDQESRIFLKEGADPKEATSYTSVLYERYVQQGAFLEQENGGYLFTWKTIHPMGIRVRALNFLQVLAFLEYYDQLRQRKHAEAMAALKAYYEQEKAKKLAEEKAESKGFELEEKDGVTFIKNTTFVISKIM